MKEIKKIMSKLGIRVLVPKSEKQLIPFFILGRTKDICRRYKETRYQYGGPIISYNLSFHYEEPIPKYLTRIIALLSKFTEVKYHWRDSVVEGVVIRSLNCIGKVDAIDASNIILVFINENLNKLISHKASEQKRLLQVNRRRKAKGRVFKTLMPTKEYTSEYLKYMLVELEDILEKELDIDKNHNRDIMEARIEEYVNNNLKNRPKWIKL
jgi:hypothetical protein